MKKSLFFLIMFVSVYQITTAQKVIFVNDTTQYKTYFPNYSNALFSMTIGKDGKARYNTVVANSNQNTAKHDPPKRFNSTQLNKTLTREFINVGYPDIHQGNFLLFNIFSNSFNQVDSIAYCITYMDTSIKAPTGGILWRERFIPFQNENDFSKVRQASNNLISELKPGKTQLYSRISKVSTQNLENFLTQKADTITVISLAKFGLTQFPEELKRFKSLKEIDLGDNYINQLKIRKKDFPKLETLTLQNNLLTNQSLRIKGIKLKTLNLNTNHFTHIPQKTAQTLLLANSDIKAVKTSDIRRLKKTENLNLYSNKVNYLSPKIFRLKKLKELDLYRNDLSHLPKNLMRLPKLETLAVSYNDLTEIPSEIENLKTLKVFYAHHNQFKELPNFPNSLEILDVGYNKLTSISAIVKPIKTLKSLDYSNNKVNGDLDFLLTLPNIQEIYLFENQYAETDEDAKYFSNIFYQLTSKGVKVK